MKADLVYLIADENIATDKSTKFQTEIIKQLKKKKIDSKVVHANRLQLFDIIRVVKEIILDHRNDEFYVNVASGSKIHAIGCMMACMVFDDQKKHSSVLSASKRVSCIQRQRAANLRG